MSADYYVTFRAIVDDSYKPCNARMAFPRRKGHFHILLMVIYKHLAQPSSTSDL